MQPMTPNPTFELSNAAFHLGLTPGDEVLIALRDAAADALLAEGAYI